MSDQAVHQFVESSESVSKAELAAWMVLAKKRFKKGYLAQYFDIRRLKKSFGRLSAGEYYLYRLFAKDRAAQEEFLGSDARGEIYRSANDPKWIPVESSKIETGKLLRSHGLPVPRDYALYHPSADTKGVRSLRSKEEVATFLRSGMPYPFFSKLLAGTNGVGVVAARSYDQASDQLLLAGDKSVEVDDFVAWISGFFDQGYLFQELLEPHAEVERICGHRLSSVRAMVLYEDDGEPELYCTVWKIPVGDNVADNAWHKGNLLAAVDIETGGVTRVVAGFGAQEHEVEDHPDTGRRIKGMTLPDWDRLRALCDASARAFPGLRLQAWDVALTDRGPVMVEINGAGGFTIPQRAAGKGLMAGRLRDFIEHLNR